MSARLRILVPAHNEANRITPMLTDYCERFRSTAIIAVVANACSDGTPAVVRQLMERFPNLQLLAINGRIGKGGAIRAGLKTGNEPYIGFADADGSTSAQEFERLFRHCIESGADGVIGSRWLPGAVVAPRQPLLRRVASRAFNGLARSLFGLPFVDTQCGAKIFKREAVRRVLSSLEVAGFAFDIDLLSKLHREGFQVLEVPTCWSDRAVGTKVQVLRSSLTMLKTLLRLRLQNSAFWRLPFTEFFARDAVIPVKEKTRVLVICNSTEQGGWAAVMRGRLATLERHGYSITFADDLVGRRRGIAFPAALLAWYLLRSRREFDAVVEIAGNMPAFIPAFSAKRSVVVKNDEDSLSRWARYVYANLYGASAVVRFAGGSDGEALEITAALIDAIGVAPIYSASFQESADGWILNFTDIQSGDLVSQALK